MRENSRGGTRTPDPPVNSRLLYRLSYSGPQPRILDGQSLEINVFLAFYLNAAYPDSATATS